MVSSWFLNGFCKSVRYVSAPVLAALHAQQAPELKQGLAGALFRGLDQALPLRFREGSSTSAIFRVHLLDGELSRSSLKGSVAFKSDVFESQMPLRCLEEGQDVAQALLVVVTTRETVRKKGLSGFRSCTNLVPAARTELSFYIQPQLTTSSAASSQILLSFEGPRSFGALGRHSREGTRPKDA